jgi:hypothetical protein
MRKDILKIISSLAVGFGLLSIYLVFLQYFVKTVDLSMMSEVETIIFYTQILRVIVVTGVGLRYQIQPIVPIIVFSFEALLIPPLLVLIVLTNAPFYAAFMGVILTAWFGATTLTVEPYAIFVFTRSLAKDTAISSVLSVGALELISVLFLSTMLSQVTQPIEGLVGLGTLIITQIRTITGSNGVPNPGQDFLSSLGLLLFFLGMMCYMTLGNYTLSSKMRLPWMLVVSFVGLILAFLWVVLVSPHEPDIFVTLTAPAIALLAIMWGSARDR